MTDLREARVFSKYLIGEVAGEHLLQRYHHAIIKNINAHDVREEKLVAFCVKRPALVPFADAALAFGNRNHLLRKKLLIMLAILETTPEYYEHFTSLEQNRFAWLSVFRRGAGAVFKMIVGKVILFFI